MATTRIQLYSRSVVFEGNGSLAPKEVSQRFAAMAREQIAEVGSSNEAIVGHATPVTTFVDGRETDDLESVRPDGVILARFDVGNDLVQFVFDLLQNSAPVRSGRFKNSLTIFADGNEVPDPESAQGAKEVVISSVVPYARKIERGQSKMAPRGIFQAAAVMAAARYGNVASIKFGFRSLTGMGTDLEAWARPHSAKRKRPVKQYEKDTRQPAVVISF